MKHTRYHIVIIKKSFKIVASHFPIAKNYGFVLTEVLVLQQVEYGAEFVFLHHHLDNLLDVLIGGILLLRQFDDDRFFDLTLSHVGDPRTLR